MSELPHFAAPRSANSSDEWYTPDAVVRALGEFDLDPATSIQRGHQVAPAWFTVAEDGLKQPWFGRVWCNPPFSRIHPWIMRMRLHNSAKGEAGRGSTADRRTVREALGAGREVRPPESAAERPG